MALGNLVAELGLGTDAEPSVTLKDLISQHFRTGGMVPPLAPNATLRASGLASLCPREEVLRTLHGVSYEDSIDPNLNLIFSHGHGLHYAMQNKVLPALPDVLVGRWKCLNCGKAHGPESFIQKFDQGALVPRPKACASCNAPEFIYDEVFLKSPEYRIGGHPDGFLRVPGRSDVGLLEVKSIGRASAVRQVPDMGHVIQAHVYLWLCDLKWAIIVYWEKGTNGLAGLTEHFVERDEETIDRIKATCRSIFEPLESWWTASAKATADGLPAPALPVLPDRICSSRDCERAEDCCVAGICFPKE